MEEEREEEREEEVEQKERAKKKGRKKNSKPLFFLIAFLFFERRRCFRFLAPQSTRSAAGECLLSRSEAERSGGAWLFRLARSEKRPPPLPTAAHRRRPIPCFFLPLFPLSSLLARLCSPSPAHASKHTNVKSCLACREQEGSEALERSSERFGFKAAAEARRRSAFFFFLLNRSPFLTSLLALVALSHPLSNRHCGNKERFLSFLRSRGAFKRSRGAFKRWLPRAAAAPLPQRRRSSLGGRHGRRRPRRPPLPLPLLLLLLLLPPPPPPQHPGSAAASPARRRQWRRRPTLLRR